MIVSGWTGSDARQVRVDNDGNVYIVDSNGMSFPEHDSRKGTWTNGKLTKVEYFKGGLSGTLVATLTLGYDANGKWESAVRT
jgi:hypothetical protein